MTTPKRTKSSYGSAKRIKKPAASRALAKIPEWKENLGSYKELQILRFENDQQLDAAIGLLWTDELRFLPHDTPDGKSIIIPKEAVEYFERAGLKFRAVRMRTMDELTPEERAKLRR